MSQNVILADAATYLLELGSYDEDDLDVLRFEGTEAISHPFSFRVELTSRDGDLDFDRIVGKQARLTMRGTEGDRHVHGMAARFQQSGRTAKHTFYEVEIVPRMWILSHRVTCRIFQEQTIREIISSVLTQAGLAEGADFRFQLSGNHPQRTYCVQYRESDLAFVSRLLEEEGVFYYFEQKDKGETLVMADYPGTHRPITGDPELRYAPQGGMAAGEEQVFDLVFAQTVCPGAYRLRDFRFEQPSLELDAQTSTAAHPELEVYDYPGEYEDPGVGESLARVRLEQQQVFRLAATGQSNCLRFAVGELFEVTEHPRQDFNREYLLTEVCHVGAHPQSLEEEVAIGGTVREARYANRFTVIPASVPFRPPRMTPRPTVRGVQTAIVVGPQGEEIHTDTHGRVKVQFHWDLAGARDGQSSCWIRVSHPWAGKGWGNLALPRIGQEVIIDFLEGDPDRPILTGRVYNGDCPPPHDLPAQKANMTIRSDSLDGQEGFNEITLNDTGGRERIFVHGQRDMESCVRRDRLETVGNERHLIVGDGDKGTGNRCELVRGTQQLNVKKDHVEKVEGNMLLTVGRGEGEGGNLDIVIEKDKKELIEAASHLQVKGDLCEKVDGSRSLIVAGDHHARIGECHAVEAGQEIHLKAGARLVIEAGAQVTLKASGGFVDIGPGGVTIQGTMVNINSGGAAGTGSGASPSEPEEPQEAAPGEPTEVGSRQRQ